MLRQLKLEVDPYNRFFIVDPKELHTEKYGEFWEDDEGRLLFTCPTCENNNSDAVSKCPNCGQVIKGYR